MSQKQSPSNSQHIDYGGGQEYISERNQDVPKEVLLQNVMLFKNRQSPLYERYTKPDLHIHYIYLVMNYIQIDRQINIGRQVFKYIYFYNKWVGQFDYRIWQTAVTYAIDLADL